MMSQQTIYNAVASRGYSPHNLNMRPDQYAARQMVKAIEEALEALKSTIITDYPDFMLRINDLERSFKQLFDDVEAWQHCIVDERRLLEELPDVAIPCYCAAQAMGVELLTIAEVKSGADVRRGVR